MSAFSPEVLAAAAEQREVSLTTFGRRTGRPRRVTIWISTDGSRLFVRSGGGLGRHWTRNLLARPEGVLQLEGLEVPVRARHLADAGEARSVSALVRRKYGQMVRGSKPGQPPTPAEHATFELLPAAG